MDVGGEIFLWTPMSVFSLVRRFFHSVLLFTRRRLQNKNNYDLFNSAPLLRSDLEKMLFFLPLLLLHSTPTSSLSLPTCPVNPTSNPNPILPGLPEYQCVSLSSWTADRFNDASACGEAFTYAKTIESVHKTTRFEFLPTHHPPSTRYPRMDTPRRYTKRGCTVAIVMLSSFPDDDLPPGQPPGRKRYDSTVTTFERVWEAGQYVWECCVEYGRPGPTPGWNNAGWYRKSVGIFFWSTNSDMDNRISGGPWFNGDADGGVEGRNGTGGVDTA